MNRFQRGKIDYSSTDFHLSMQHPVQTVTVLQKERTGRIFLQKPLLESELIATKTCKKQILSLNILAVGPMIQNLIDRNICEFLSPYRLPLGQLLKPSSESFLCRSTKMARRRVG